MDASHAGLIIKNSNNIVISTNIAIAFTVGLFGGGSIVGIIISMVGKFGDGFAKEYFLKRADERTRRLDASKDITAFCTEGMKTGFRHKPRDEEHILFRANEIDSIDLEVGKKLRAFLNSWMQCRDFLKDNPNEIERERMTMGFRNDAQKYGEELLKISSNWSNS